MTGQNAVAREEELEKMWSIVESQIEPVKYKQVNIKYLKHRGERKYNA